MSKNRLEDLSGLLSAYLDGELEESARAEVVAYLERDAGAVQLLNELRETRSMLQDLPRHSAPSGFSEGVVSAVERQSLLGGDSSTSGQLSPRRRWGPIRAAASVALLVGAAGTWIYWQSDRRQSTDLALREIEAIGTIAGSASGEAVELEGDLVVADGSTAEPIHREESPTHFKKGPRGKAAVPFATSSANSDMAEEAELELTKQHDQSMVRQDLITPAGVDVDDEVVALALDLDTSTVFSLSAEADPLDFGLAGQLRGARQGGAVPADFSRRLQANEPAASLAFHDFSSESNSLTLSFSTDDQRDEFMQDVDVYLSDHGFLSAADPRERIQVVQPLNQNVVLHGRQGWNYDEPRSEQILLNAAPAVMEGLIDRYAEKTGELGNQPTIELQIGETKVEGLESTRSTVRALADRLADQAADPDEQLSAAQWRQHFAQLGLVAKLSENQAAVPAQSEEESGKVAGDAEVERDGRGVASDTSPARKAGRGESSDLKEDLRPGKQTATAGEQEQGQAGAKQKKRRARSAKDMPEDEIELFGGGDQSPPASEPAGGGSRGGGGGSGGGGGALSRQKSLGPSRPIGRASNLTFVLKLLTVPPANPEPIPEMGPPAPPSAPDDLKK